MLRRVVRHGLPTAGTLTRFAHRLPSALASRVWRRGALWLTPGAVTPQGRDVGRGGGRCHAAAHAGLALVPRGPQHFLELSTYYTV